MDSNDVELSGRVAGFIRPSKTVNINKFYIYIHLEYLKKWQPTIHPNSKDWYKITSKEINIVSLLLKYIRNVAFFNFCFINLE